MRDTTEDRQPLVVDEFGAAAALKMSVHTLRKDRTGARLIPFYRIGGTIRYNLDRVREALAQYEVGGPSPSRRTQRRSVVPQP